MTQSLERAFPTIVPPEADFCSLRFVEERTEHVCVRQGVLQPVVNFDDVGAMVTVVKGDGVGYAATSDLSPSGLKQAGRVALRWAERTAGRSIADARTLPRPDTKGSYESSVRRPWEAVSLGDKVDLLRAQNERLKSDPRIVDWSAQLTGVASETLFLTSAGGRLHQRFRYVIPQMEATANEGTETERRTLGGYGLGRQGGLEVLDEIGYDAAAPRLAEEALALLAA